MLLFFLAKYIQCLNLRKKQIQIEKTNWNMLKENIYKDYNIMILLKGEWKTGEDPRTALDRSEYQYSYLRTGIIRSSDYADFIALEKVPS